MPPAFAMSASMSPDDTLGMSVSPLRATNVAFGGPGNKTLYITASSSIYRVWLNVPGAPLVRNK